MQLTRDEREAVYRLALPIAPHRRRDFFAAVEAKLRGAEVGPGVCYRIAGEVQRSFLRQLHQDAANERR
jgi:hypothetical protein